MGPVPQLLILIGNALTPGKGFRKGPFASEAELRAMVDLAEQESLIEDEERRMVHSVFELGDTLVREVMVPRTDLVCIERYKTVRQALTLALRSGFSRSGHRRERGRHRRNRLPQGPRRARRTSTGTRRRTSSPRRCARRVRARHEERR